MLLKQGFEAFKEKYPFLCLTQDSSENEILYSMCLFPTEILEKELYIGNRHNFNSKKQLKSLQITSCLCLFADQN